MKTIGLQIAIGLAIMFGSAAAHAETIRTAMNNGAVAVEPDLSSRQQRHHHRAVRMHKRYYMYSSYPRAPWHSIDYFPRYQLNHPAPVRGAYRE